MKTEHITGTHSKAHICTQIMDNGDEPVSGSCIRDITGLHNEEIIRAILVTGASRREIQQARNLCDENYHTTTFRRPATERVRHICNILDYGRDVLD